MAGGFTRPPSDVNSSLPSQIDPPPPRDEFPKALLLKHLTLLYA